MLFYKLGENGGHPPQKRNMESNPDLLQTIDLEYRPWNYKVQNTSSLRELLERMDF